MKKLALITFTLLAITACKKDEVPACNKHTSISQSESELDLAIDSESELFSIEFDASESVEEKAFDLNCDGVADIHIGVVSEWTQTYTSGSQSHTFKILIQPLNTETFILAETVTDSIYSTETIDSSGSMVTEEYYYSTDWTEGATFYDLKEDVFALPLYAGETLSATDERWINDMVHLRSHWWHSGHYDITVEYDYSRGLFPLDKMSFLGIKFEDETGIKLGYLKIRPTSNSVEMEILVFEK